MTDDELDRALLALPLEEPPADLRSRILAATVYRPRITIRAWEIYVVGTLAAIAVWMAWFVMTGVPDSGERIGFALSAAIDQVAASLGSTTMLWVMLGVSSALWISQFTLPTHRRRADH